MTAWMVLGVFMAGVLVGGVLAAVAVVVFFGGKLLPPKW